MSAEQTAERRPSSASMDGDTEAAPSFPDFYTDPNAVLKDTSAAWRFGKAPDYSRTRAFYAESKQCQFVI